MTVSLVLSTMTPAWAEEVTEVYSDQEMSEDNFANSDVVSEDQEAEITSDNLEPAEQIHSPTRWNRQKQIHSSTRWNRQKHSHMRMNRQKQSYNRMTQYRQIQKIIRKSTADEEVAGQEDSVITGTSCRRNRCDSRAQACHLLRQSDYQMTWLLTKRIIRLLTLQMEQA